MNTEFDPNNFLVSELTTKETNNGKFYFQYVMLHGKKVELSGKVSEQMNGFIEFESFRPKRFHKEGVEYIEYISIEEYFDDLLKFFSALAQLEPQLDSLAVSLMEICKLHVKQANRLIDTDLYTYCDEAIIVSEIVLQSSDPTFIMPQQDKIDLWNECKEFVFSYFKDVIYITNYVLDNEIGFSIKPVLTKFT